MPKTKEICHGVLWPQTNLPVVWHMAGLTFCFMLPFVSCTSPSQNPTHWKWIISRENALSEGRDGIYPSCVSSYPTQMAQCLTHCGRSTHLLYGIVLKGGISHMAGLQWGIFLDTEVDGRRREQKCGKKKCPFLVGGREDRQQFCWTVWKHLPTFSPIHNVYCL